MIKPLRTCLGDALNHVAECCEARDRNAYAWDGTLDALVPTSALAAGQMALGLAAATRGKVLFLANGVSAHALMLNLVLHEARVPLEKAALGLLEHVDFVDLIAAAERLKWLTVVFDDRPLGSSAKGLDTEALRALVREQLPHRIVACLGEGLGKSREFYDFRRVLINTGVTTVLCEGDAD